MAVVTVTAAAGSADLAIVVACSVARPAMSAPGEADRRRHPKQCRLEDPRVFEDSLHDRWYTAAEALEYGFIDAIVQSFDDIAPRTQRHFALGMPAERRTA